MLKEKEKEAKLIFSDVFSWILMICGSIMAVANGLIPSLGTIIYGKLVDELVIHNNVDRCTLNESVTTIKLRNITEFTIIYPRMKGIIINETRSINVLLNGSHVRVEVVGLTGIQMKEVNVKQGNGSSIILNATSFDGAKLEGVNVKGTRVQMVALQETNARVRTLIGDNKGVQKPQAQEAKNGTSVNGTPNNDTGGNKTKFIESQMKAEEREKNEIDKKTIKNENREKNTSIEQINENNNSATGKGKGGPNPTAVIKEQVSNEIVKIRETAKECKDLNEIDNNLAFETEKAINENGEAIDPDSKYKANTEEKLTNAKKDEEIMDSTYLGNIRRRGLYSDSNGESTSSNKHKSEYGGTNNTFTRTLKYPSPRFLIKAITRHYFKRTQESLAMEIQPKSGTRRSEKPRKATVAKTPNLTEKTNENISTVHVNISNPNGTKSVTSNGFGVIVTKVDSTGKVSHGEVISPKTRNINYIVYNITENCKSIQSHIEASMMKYALYYVYAAVGTLVFAYGQIVFWNIASERGLQNLSENLTQTAMKEEPAYYDSKAYEGEVSFKTLNNPLEWINHIELGGLNGGVGGEIAYLIQSVSSLTSGFFVSFIENWKITLVMIVAAPILGIIQGIAYKVEGFVTAGKDELMHQACSMAEKSLRSMKTDLSFAGEKIEKTRFSKKLGATDNLIGIKSIILGARKGLTTVVMFGFLGLGFWYSSSLLHEGKVTPGTLMTIFMAIISGVMQVSGAGKQLEDVTQAKTAFSLLLGTSQQEEEDQDSFDKAVKQLENIVGKLEVFNVSFHFPSRPDYQILKSVNCTVEEGQTIALLGDKECGKSTLIKLLQRIFDPQTGKVRLDGHDLRCLDREWFRRQVGIVHQKPQFFNRSIAENISYGKEGCTFKQIVQAAKDAGAHEFIETLPRRYATVLSDNGLPLMPYQKHLLALARALIRNPRILLWEEDQSIMDNASLNALRRYLDKVRRGQTTVISTSHVSFARIADVVFVLHEGKIIEEGSPDKLLQSGGAFSYLTTLQYFESKTLLRENLLQVVPSTTRSPPVLKWVEALESTFAEKQEQAEDQVKCFITRIHEMLRDKVTLEPSQLSVGKVAYEMIVMQLEDLPLLIAGALGAAVTGMLAPGLAFLFHEVQKIFNDPVRVSQEGTFWASMFVLLGVVVGFGGTIEKFMLNYAREKLRVRLQEMAFDSTMNKVRRPEDRLANTIPGSHHTTTADRTVHFSGVSTNAAACSDGRVPGLPSTFLEETEDMSRLVPSLVGHGPGGITRASSGMPFRDPSQLMGTGSSPDPNLLMVPNPEKQAEPMINQIETDVETTLQNSISRYLSAQVQETVSSVSILGMALYNGWKMTLVVLAGIPIISLANRLQQNETEASVEPQGVEALMSTSFKKMETITALGLESQFAKKYKDDIIEKYRHLNTLARRNAYRIVQTSTAKPYQYGLKKILTGGLAFAIGQAMVFIIYAAALRFGCYLVNIGDMTAIQVLGVLMTVLFGSHATATSRAPCHPSAHAKESLDRLFDGETANLKDQSCDKLEQVEGKLGFHHVQLPDPSGKAGQLLRQLNVKVSGGQTIAVVPLNNEKINSVELLMERFYDPVGDRLLLDETDIRSFDLCWLRDQLVVVSHRSFMAHLSIAENIAYGDNKRNITRREIEEAAYLTFAHEFIMGLPKGYDTVPDKDEITPTNSQKQKISIARALIRVPPILIVEDLEEVDQVVNDATKILSRNKTCLIMTRHRATIEAADKILLLYRGHVLEQGNS